MRINKAVIWFLLYICQLKCRHGRLNAAMIIRRSLCGPFVNEDQTEGINKDLQHRNQKYNWNVESFPIPYLLRTAFLTLNVTFQYLRHVNFPLCVWMTWLPLHFPCSRLVTSVVCAHFMASHMGPTCRYASLPIKKEKKKTGNLWLLNTVVRHVIACSIYK